MTWLPRTASGTTPFERVFELRPELRRRYQEFDALFWETQPVSAALLERCRVRIAEILGVDPGPAHPAAAAALPPTPEAERACLALAQKFVLDPHGVTDADAAAVRAALGDAGLVALVDALALFDGFLRFRAILGAS